MHNTAIRMQLKNCKPLKREKNSRPVVELPNRKGGKMKNSVMG